MNQNKIMIVDDQKSNIALLKSYLKEFDILEADNGRAALKKINETKPDLILLDVLMPGVDGFSVLSILKASKETQLIPVILITALKGIDEKIRSLEKGADDFLSKPINPLELKARINNLLKIRSLNKELGNINNALFTLVETLEAKNKFMIDHSKKTSSYARKLAEIILLPPNIQENIGLASLLHDIGKVAIQDTILLKPSKLEAEELEIIKTHSVIGERICSKVSALKPILPLIRYHHEYYNGKGYPDGLTGNDIPLGARIIAIADAYIALNSERVYRPAYSQQEALNILQEGAGQQWDPELVGKFVELFAQPTV